LLFQNNNSLPGFQCFVKKENGPNSLSGSTKINDKVYFDQSIIGLHTIFCDRKFILSLWQCEKKNDLVDCIKNETTTQKIDIDGAPDRSQGGACRILF